MIDLLSLLQGSELSGWATGHFTEDGFDIFQNFPDLSKILWDAEDKGMVPKITPNHHVSIPEDYEDTYSVRRTLQFYARNIEDRVSGRYLQFNWSVTYLLNVFVTKICSVLVI